MAMNIQLDFFANTIGLLPSEKIGREKIALTQTEKILRFFEANPAKEFTPCFGEGRAVYEKKRGKITCDRCIELIKKYKAIRL